MFTIHFHIPRQWHWLPSSHKLVMHPANSKYYYQCSCYEWLFIGVERRISAKMLNALCVDAVVNAAETVQAFGRTSAQAAAAFNEFGRAARKLEDDVNRSR